MRLRIPDAETNPGQRRPVPAVCRLFCNNLQGLSGTISDLTMSSSQHDILLCSETLVSELLVPEFGRPVLLYRGTMVRAREIVAYVRDGYGAFRQPNIDCGCSEMLFFRVCGVRRNFYLFTPYLNPDLDEKIFDCLLTSIAAVQAKDVCASFLFVGDLNGQHQEWFGSMTKNRH